MIEIQAFPRSARRARLMLASALLAGTAASAQAQDEGGAAVSQGAHIDRQTIDGQALASGDDGTIVGVDGRRRLELAVYNNGRAMVRETRQLPLLSGVNRLKFTGVSKALVETSIRLETPSGVTVQAQGFDEGAPGLERLLRRHVGQAVTLVRENPATGEQITTRARLLGLSDGVPLVSVDGRIELAGPDFPWRFTFQGPREARFWQPGVRALVSAEESRGVDLQLSYLTGGLGWEADYDLVLPEAGGEGSLSGWASIRNDSGVGYDNAAVTLIAGEVATQDEPPRPMARGAAMESAADVRRGELGGAYHRYVLPGRVSLADGETRQLPLMDMPGIEVQRAYRVRHRAAAHTRSDPQPQAVAMTLSLAPASREGPLPGGVVRVYERGDDGALRWLGEDRIGHTPVDAPLRLEIGRAFDVQAKRRQTVYERLSDRSYESGWAITLSNATDGPVDVTVVEQLDGDWKLQDAEPAPAERDARNVTWRVEVPAGGATTVRYRVRVNY
ncbi:DUF4139 domain-containing protein [Ectothiorhodospiraceae bacterium WFHF3C12]|nr:DUF4139 domain-containing protein [Ectothiorhodospiraceae bacterium WFHF3C12]